MPNSASVARSIPKPAKAAVRIAHALSAAWLRFEALPSWQASLLIFGLSMALRMAVVILFHMYIKPDRYEMERAALSIARHGTLADPYLIPTGPTAHVAPAYALFLGAIFRLFGTGAWGEFVKRFCASAAASVQYALLPVVSPALGMRRRVGLFAGLAGAVAPLKFSIEVSGDWEAPFVALALLLLIYRIALTWKDGRYSARQGLLQGIGWGAALLCSPNLLPVFFAVTALGLVLGGRRRPRAYLTFAAANILAITLCLAPWAIRNQRALGAPIFTRSNFGLEMRISNNDAASPLEPVNLKNGLYERFHPLMNLTEAEAVRAMGEVAYNRRCLEEASFWIRTHPVRFAELAAERVWYVWFPRTSAPARDAVEVLVVVACGLGLALLWKQDRTSALLLIVCLLSYNAVYSLVQIMVRYRYPVDWIILLAASCFAVFALKSLAARLGMRVSTIGSGT